MSDDQKKNPFSRSESEWKKILNPEQFRVCREKATEPAFTGAYHHTKEPGVYLCAACKHPVFNSEAKYDSGSGWPSFWQPISTDNVDTQIDRSHAMERVEVHCARCKSHLGHVFEDGPQPTGLRYCINSTALELDKKKA